MRAATPSAVAGAALVPAGLPAVTNALTPERAVGFRRIAELTFSPDGGRLACAVLLATDTGTESHIWILDRRRNELRQATFSAASERTPRWSPDGRALAFLSSRGGADQVYRMPIDGGEAVALTTAPGGVSDFRFAPAGKRIAFLARDPSENTAGDALVADREDDLERVWILELASNTVRRLTHEPFLIRELTWPSPQRLLVVANDEPRKESWDDAIYGIDADDGRFRFVARPAPPFGGLVPSPGGARLAYVGTDARGPIPHDAFVSPAGGTAQNRSRLLDRAVLDVRWQSDAVLVFRAADGFRNRLYRLGEDGGPSPIALPYSARSFDVARDGTIAFVGVGFNHLPELYVKPAQGTVSQVGRVQDDDWDAFTLTEPEIFRVKSFDQTEIEAALFTAATPGSEKRPLVLLVHGGPNANFSADYTWFNVWPQLLAAHGYDVLLVNPRGSTGYGEAFVKANRGDCGGGDYQDLLAALDHVIARGHTDPERLGIAGWSYGGEMAAWAIGHTARFHAAVVGAGVFDQAAEFGTEDEPAGDEWHFGTPWNDPEVFARNSPASFIRNAKTPTLILHGDADRSNPLGQSRALYRALKHLGVETELVVYPGEPHGPRKAKHQADIAARLLRWFDVHLR